MATIRFYFDFASPYSYLAATQLDAVAARTGASFTWTPVFLPGIMKATGNGPPAALPARAKYMAQDLGRWAAVYNVPLRMTPHFPFTAQNALRAALALQSESAAAFRPFVDAVFHAVWADGLDVTDRALLAQLAVKAGAPAALAQAAPDDPKWKDALRANTDDAVARGAFGVPSFVLGDDELYFGNDRLALLEQRLSRGAPFPALEVSPGIDLSGGVSGGG